MTSNAGRDDEKMVGGLAFVAYPAEYRNSGVMTFIINQDGVLLQKDLGKTTAETASAMSQYDTDTGWTPVKAADDGNLFLPKQPRRFRPDFW
jgi:hypothetical protein